MRLWRTRRRPSCGRPVRRNVSGVDGDLTGLVGLLGGEGAYQTVDIDVGHVLHCFLCLFDVFLGCQVVVVCAERYQVRVTRWRGAVCDGVQQFVVWVRHAGP